MDWPLGVAGSHPSRGARIPLLQASALRPGCRGNGGSGLAVGAEGRHAAAVFAPVLEAVAVAGAGLPDLAPRSRPAGLDRDHRAADEARGACATHGAGRRPQRTDAAAQPGGTASCAARLRAASPPLGHFVGNHVMVCVWGSPVMESCSSELTVQGMEVSTILADARTCTARGAGTLVAGAGRPASGAWQGNTPVHC